MSASSPLPQSARRSFAIARGLLPHRRSGSWQASPRSGRGGVADAYWFVEPTVTLPPGTYTVVDSEPTTWTQSTWTKGVDYAEVRGYPAP
jgi:hypothetical protein